MDFNKLIKQLINLINKLFWILFFLMLILWYSNNKNKFFPQREVPYTPNPLNPFKK
jgi:hypothetical protein